MIKKNKTYLFTKKKGNTSLSDLQEQALTEINRENRKKSHIDTNKIIFNKIKF